jgi:hypothetical protein
MVDWEDIDGLIILYDSMYEGLAINSGIRNEWNARLNHLVEIATAKTCMNLSLSVPRGSAPNHFRLEEYIALLIDSTLLTALDVSNARGIKQPNEVIME